MNRKLVEAVRALVDATLTAQCTEIEGDEGSANELHCVDCALDVLRKIRAEPDLCKLHAWADERLEACSWAGGQLPPTWEELFGK